MEALGRHVLVELFDCPATLLNDTDRIEQIMQESALKCGATIVQSVFHRFNPHGVSGVVVIAESHLSIHTWPEYGYAAVDVFTCGDEIDPWIGVEHLREHLQAKRFDAFELKRGKLDAPSLKHKPS